jgi:hypothetical protein
MTIATATLIDVAIAYYYDCCLELQRLDTASAEAASKN